MSRLRCSISVIILAYVLNVVVSYQFDADNLILYEDATVDGYGKSYFGYSLDIRNHPDPKITKPSIIVGAPRANSSFDKRVVQPGTVFKCDIGEKCEEWNLTPRRNNSWLGAAVAVENSKILETVVCAPRWGGETVYHYESMAGMCFRVNTDNFSNPSPNSIYPVKVQEKLKKVSVKGGIRTDRHAHLAASGFSIHSIPDLTRNLNGIRYVVGAPGFYSDAGSLFLCKNDDTFLTPNLTNNVAYIDYDFYGGYAVTSGNYSRGAYSYVMGSPRGKLPIIKKLVGAILTVRVDKSGKVFQKMKDEATYGEQFGEYFGAALASCKINGRKEYDRLLVGAPFWSKSGSQEEGRIYIMKTVEEVVEKSVLPNFKIDYHIDGKKPKARFGSAITCLGDLDYDGFEDVAIGAPYEGDGRGAVYIYHGGPDELKSPQKIEAPEVTKGFGFSISKAIDIDNNGFADFAIGAYRSGHVTLVRSKRVVTTNVKLTIPETDSLIIKRNYESFKIKACSTFGGEHRPHELSVTRWFKIDENHHRAYINVSNDSQREFNDTVTLKIEESPPPCQTYDVHLYENNVKFIEPLKISVTQRLTTNNNTGMLTIRKDGKKIGVDRYETSSAVAYKNQEYKEREARSEIEIFFEVTECGAQCVSSLSIHMEVVDDSINVTHYVIGSGTAIKLRITVNNTADPAYWTNSYLRMPDFIKLGNAPSECNSYEIRNQTEIKCYLGNVIEKNTPSIIDYQLDTTRVPNNAREILLEAEVTTQSNNTARQNKNDNKILINCIREADIGIMGETDIDLHRFNMSEKENQLSNTVQIRHTYEIKSHGVTPITEAILSVSYPTELIHRGERIKILGLNDTITNWAGKQFKCMIRDESSRDNMDSPGSDAYTSTEWLIGNNISKFDIINGKVFASSLDNVTSFINCTNPAVTCETLDCNPGGPLDSTQPTASLVLVFDVLLHRFTPEIMRGKNVIFIVTNGSAITTDESGINNEPDSILIGTRFIGEPSYQEPPSMRILAMAVGVGLLLLMFIIMGLCKFGFFNRNKKKELLLAKEEYAIKNSSPSFFILETTSAED